MPTITLHNVELTNYHKKLPDGTLTYPLYEGFDQNGSAPINEWVSFDVDAPNDPDRAQFTPEAGESTPEVCSECGKTIRKGWFALSVGTILCPEHVYAPAQSQILYPICPNPSHTGDCGNECNPCTCCAGDAP